MKNLKKAAWTTLAVLSSLLALFTLLLIGVQTADWIKYGYRSTDLKYVLLAGGFSIAMAVLAVLGIRMAGKIREKQPALSAAPLQVSDMRREPERKIYRSAPRLLVAEFGKKLIFLGFFCILAVQLLLSGNPNLFLSLPFPAWVSEWILPVLLAALLSSLWAFYWCRIRIEISRDGLAFFRRNRPYAFYPLDAPLQVSVTKKSWNGLFLGTSREFFLPGRGPLRKTVSCWCIDNASFSSLVEEFNRLRQDGPKESPLRPAREDLYGLGQNSVFRLPKEELLSREKARLLAISAGSAGAGLLLALLWFFLVYRGPLNGHAAACALFIFLFFSLAALPQALRYRSLASRIPERITLTNASIRIDERSFSARELKSVVMTPASQTVSGGGISFRRQLFLQTALEQTKYLLGSTPDAPKGLLYEEYGSLLETIRSWCAEQGVSFRENLN